MFQSGQPLLAERGHVSSCRVDLVSGFSVIRKRTLDPEIRCTSGVTIPTSDRLTRRVNLARYSTSTELRSQRCQPKTSLYEREERGGSLDWSLDEL